MQPTEGAKLSIKICQVLEKVGIISYILHKIIFPNFPSRPAEKRRYNRTFGKYLLHSNEQINQPAAYSLSFLKKIVSFFSKYWHESVHT